MERDQDPTSQTEAPGLEQTQSTEEEQEFAKWLLNASGMDAGTSPDGVLKLPDEMVCADSNALIDAVYPDIQGRRPAPEYFLDRSILAARNKDVHGINQEILDCMGGEEIVLISADSVDREAGADGDLNEALPVEYLRSLDASAAPTRRAQIETGLSTHPLAKPLTREWPMQWNANGPASGNRESVGSAADRWRP